MTSRLHNVIHNNDAMLGVKTCRAARTCCAGRAHWCSASQSVRGPGQARRYGMQGLARWLHAWRWRTYVAVLRLTPNTRGRPSVTSYAYGLLHVTRPTLKIPPYPRFFFLLRNFRIKKLRNCHKKFS